MKVRYLAVMTVAVLGASLIGSGSAWASTPPSNDELSTATVISSIPYSVTEDVTGATTGASDPSQCLFPGQQFPTSTVWFTYTPPTNSVARLTIHAHYDAILQVLTMLPSEPGYLSRYLCSSGDGAGNISASLEFVPGRQYVIVVAGWQGAGILQMSLVQPDPPANDAFAAATPVTSTPFSDSIDTTVATNEPGEPSPSCNFSRNVHATTWYSYTAPFTGQVDTTVDVTQTGITAWTGATFSSLREAACTYGSPFQPYQQLSFQVTKGTTYFVELWTTLQIGTLLTFTLDQPFHATYVYSPPNPSTLDSVSFTDTTTDPLGKAIVAESWDFGDGVTATGCCPHHRYGTDGSYPVSLSVVTADGRTSSRTQTVVVHTDNVVIQSMASPGSARSGQTKTFTVNVTTQYYGEYVDVQLFRADPAAPGGYVVVAETKGGVQLGAASPFSFTYTFTASDAAAKKVTFKSVVTIIGYKDVKPANNTVSASVSVPS